MNPANCGMELIGATKEELETPCLCLDLNRMEANLSLMANFFKEKQKAWRPHQKAHRSVPIAQQQLKAGALGVTCATISEAEIMAAGGVQDILIANMIVDHSQLRRVAKLTEIADPILTVDHFVQAEWLSQVCTEMKTSCRLLIDVDIGFHRTGTQPGKDVVDLAQGIMSLPRLKLVGLMGYEGHLLTVSDPDEKRKSIHEAMSLLEHSRDQLKKIGVECSIISAGGTGSYFVTSECDVVTEIQAGGGIFGDSFYTEQCQISGHQPALTVLATVISRPSLERAILNAGCKRISPHVQQPTVKGFPNAEVIQLSAEHGKLLLKGASKDLRIGDRVELLVGYSDHTTLLHSQFHCFRNDQVESVWNIP